MRKIVLFLFLTTLLVGCDAPQRGRMPLRIDTLKDPSSSGTSNAISYNPGTLGSNTSGTSTGTNTGTADANFPSCDLSNRYQSIDIGYFGLCQSTVNETLFKVKFQVTTSVRNCLIPTYKDASGSSTYIGQPQCTAVNQADAVIQGTLYKNRTGWEGAVLNGVIVMKEPLLPEYFNCMNAFYNWRPAASCPNGANYSQQCYNLFYYCSQGATQSSPSICKQEATNYMSFVCNNFKTKYANSYLDIRTK